MSEMKLSRRAALLAPLALAGCDTIEGWFATKKDPLPGKRERLDASRRGFDPDPNAPGVTLPPPVRDTEWPQASGGPTHMMGHLTRGDPLKKLWSADLGEGGGYRRKILAQPVVANGVIYVGCSTHLYALYDESKAAAMNDAPAKLNLDLKQ